MRRTLPQEDGHGQGGGQKSEKHFVHGEASLILSIYGRGLGAAGLGLFINGDNRLGMAQVYHSEPTVR